MGNTKQYTAESLDRYSKEELIETVLSLQDDLFLSAEQIAILKSKLFGRKTEKQLPDGDEQMTFNEFEAEAEKGTPEEPAVEETITYTRKKRIGKRDEDLKGFPVEIVKHELTDEELTAEFGNEGYIRLADDVYRKLEVIPARYVVYEHHLAVYKGRKNGKFVRAPHPKEMLNNSIATPSIVASVMNAKYTNAMPLYRIEQEFGRMGININRQNMSHWVITCAETYLSLVFDRLHRLLCERHVLQADETPVEVSKDGRPAGSKSYMWVYRTSELSEAPPIILYDYEKTRNSERPMTFLKDFSGTLVCDGFSGYDTLAKKNDRIRTANCMAHARRPFADIVKALGESGQKRGTTAKKALSQIQRIFHAESELKGLSPEERLDRRRQEVKPLLEAYFAWAESIVDTVAPNSALAKGLKYSLNRKDELSMILEDGEIPLDNSASERAIRPFTIARKNFVLIDTVHGAEASAIIFSLVETAKANGLKIYEYLKYLLTEIPKHMDDHDDSFVEDMLPWSDNLPEECR